MESTLVIHLWTFICTMFLVSKVHVLILIERSLDPLGQMAKNIHLLYNKLLRCHTKHGMLNDGNRDAMLIT